jgi:hypothetical protein
MGQSLHWIGIERLLTSIFEEESSDEVDRMLYSRVGEGSETKAVSSILLLCLRIGLLSRLLRGLLRSRSSSFKGLFLLTLFLLR